MRKSEHGDAVLDLVTGQATLTVAILVGSTAVLVAATMSFFLVSFSATTLSFRAGNRALELAAQGAEDALLQLVRDQSFGRTPGGALYQFPPAVQEFATVLVANSGTTATIISTAAVSGVSRTLEVIASINAATGSVSVVFWRQISSS